MYQDLAVVALFAFMYSMVASRIERSVITGPMIYVGFGLLIGSNGLGIVSMEVDAIGMRVLADLALALVLFLDAASANFQVLKINAWLPGRMLLIGLPLSIALGAGLGVLIFPDVGVYELCVLAAILCATDAALGKGVVTNPAVPEKLRQTINVESGLNDGMAVPFLLIFLAIASRSVSEGDSLEMAIELVAEELLIGMVTGLVLVGCAAFLVKRYSLVKKLSDIWLQIPVVALALSCFAVAQSLGGSGFIASFVGGLLFGYIAERRTHKLVIAAESDGELICMVTWVVFAAVFLGQFLLQVTWQIALYSFLSLTVIRMVPVLISLCGTKEPLENKLFLAWFGPRGLASIVFAVIMVDYHLPSESVLLPTIVLTITLCIFAHGITANPWANRLARKYRNTEENIQENTKVNQ